MTPLSCLNSVASRRWSAPAWLGTWLVLGATACSVTRDYSRPDDLPVPPVYSSATSQPTADAPATTPTADTPVHLGQDWWVLFGDPVLNDLITTALAANEDVHAAMARVAQARAAARSVQGQYYPELSFDPSVMRTRTPSSKAGEHGSTVTRTTLPLDLTYEVDIWGRVQRSVEVAQAQGRVAELDLEVIRQTLAADVALNYFNLRSLEIQDAIILRNIELYRRQLQLVQSSRKAGLAGPLEVMPIQTVLDSALAQEVDYRRQRADLVHALAILLGRPPGDLHVAPTDDLPATALPVIPVGLPSELLRRRPDVAQAEANLVAANAQYGVAQTNLYPVLRLTGAAGFESVRLEDALNWESRMWSLGPSLTVPIFTGGQLQADVEQAQARYNEVLADYRAAVLDAFRDVEDALTDLHHRAQQAQAQDRAVASAREALRLTQVQYEKGLANYLQVIDADRTLLTNELQAEQIRTQRFLSTVLLIKALGGGWSNDDYPATQPTTQPATQPSTQPVN